MIGQRFERLIVIAPPPAPRSGYWLCLCDCGNERVISGGNLRNGNTKSCGCLRLEKTRLTGLAAFIHGHSGNANRGGDREKSPTYRSWSAMLSRCASDHPDHFADYKGRGITVCERWQGEHGFEHFLVDMKERPSGFTLDRFPDNNGNYEPGNVRWATPMQQNQHRRSTKLEPHEPAQVRWLAALGYLHHEIGSHFGVSKSTVSQIVRGKIWVHV